MITRKKVGQRMRDIGQAHGKTLEDMAKEIDCSASTLSKMERGEIEPTTTAIEKYADIFHTSIDDIFGRKP